MSLEIVQKEVQIEVQKEKPIKKQQHKLSQILLNATEKQCTGYLHRTTGKEEEYCALGLGLLYSGYKF